MEFRLHINLSKKKILTIQITLFTIHLIIINIFIDMTSRLIYGIYYIILCAHTYIYIYIHFFITVVSIRETSYLNLQAYLQQRKIYIVNDIECIYKRRNVHVSDRIYI